MGITISGPEELYDLEKADDLEDAEGLDGTEDAAVAQAGGGRDGIIVLDAGTLRKKVRGAGQEAQEGREVGGSSLAFPFGSKPFRFVCFALHIDRVLTNGQGAENMQRGVFRCRNIPQRPQGGTTMAF